MSMVEDALAGLTKGAALGSVVPGVGTAIGAGVGGLIGLASSLVPHVFGADAQDALAAAATAVTGIDDEATQVQILSTDSAALAAYKVQALRIAADREQARIDAQTDDIAARLTDTAGARQSTLDLAKAGSPIAWGAPVISVIVLVSFGTLCTLLFRAVPPGSETLLNILLGSLGTMSTTVVGYWVGSSAGSAAKDTRLAQTVPSTLIPKLGPMN